MPKEKEKGREFSAKGTVKRVQILYDTKRVKEAVAYLFLSYTKLVAEELKVEHKPSKTIRELAIELVKKKDQNPEILYPFIQKVEETIYSGFPVRKEDLLQAYDLFGKLYQALTNRSLNISLRV
ncbi:MAG: hypothetical protein Kow0069_28290 [Promethearchaeota archaeon]